MTDFDHPRFQRYKLFCDSFVLFSFSDNKHQQTLQLRNDKKLMNDNKTKRFSELETGILLQLLVVCLITNN